MTNNVKSLLPIGSVIRLNGAQKCLMVFGVCQTHKESNETYDYIGVLWPEGNLGAETQILFEHKDIQEILFVGYETEERNAFVNRLSEFYEAQNS
ncbi:MAG: DUF4176 domain-containing protein [Oscillospiraceae bacterium]|nr:DUF4176 domain-containing protein [Oscillospiraceae bacterium]